ncbi:GNAT family N-acetyltransferase [Candidatus Leptofilum sp.]|uniref:GNAT family N-acetyltransferase n=1 Tax=Candidatus Leptofilum sp. TaxID=3241576 RepID=UPI003B5CC394
MIKIALLADCPETIPTLSQWFQAQWPDYYAGRTLADIAQDFVAEANRSRIPVRLVAFADGALAGTITLREEATWILPQFRPGLGGLFVPATYRGKGIGTELVKAGMRVAQEQGYKKVYATTVAAQGILARLGWQPVPVPLLSDDHGLLFQYEF